MAVSRLALKEFFRFGCVGGLGFVVNAGVTYAASALVNLYAAGLIGWFAAASCTWFFNRIWTFAHRAKRPLLRQFLDFLGANFMGFLVYYGTYSALIAGWPLASDHPVLAVAAGSIAGLAINFTLSRRFVFRGTVEK
ncbi:putative flippase GtrA [Angulomicrobium tetraedrale]|uniref:Putative flippase GtrA n=1 Tax=Ancylobacter tetraedralis TaxID=217068 RepID=A0A839Z1W3_9HYPH|nr:GtrA family protein [Ancylobacter tetraedralis]MBB3769652.1 putative flippase GtrA [Ancylobacter tetraedralis]